MANEMPHDERASDNVVLPPDLATLDRRLETDAALWLTHLPATTRLDEHVRALPARLAAATPPIQRTTIVPTTHHKEPHMQTRIPTPPARLRSLLAATATLVVVGAIAALLIGLRANQGTPIHGGPASGGPIVQTPQPGPQASHIASIVTASGVDNAYNPTHITSTFQPGQTVYVALQVRGLPKGEQHTVSIRWLLNGQPLDIQPEVRLGWPITGDSNAYFGIKYPQGGLGTAKIYWDLPYSDASSPENLLAWTINFTIADNAIPTPALTPLPGTPTPPPTPAPTPTVPTPSGTPTPPPTPTPTVIPTVGLTPTPTPNP